MSQLSRERLVEINSEAMQGEKRSDQRLRRLMPLIHLDTSMNVIDIGCGDGKLLGYMYDKVGQYTGIDFSQRWIDQAKLRADRLGANNVTLQVGDIVEFSQSNLDRYDSAFTMDFSEHVYDDAFINIYRAIRKILKPGGKLYLHTPNGDYFLELLKKFGILKPSEGHIGIRNAAQHQVLLSRSGFQKIEIRYYPHYIPLLASIHALSFVPFVGKYFRARLFIICAA